jgi:hypothetical protein
MTTYAKCYYIGLDSFEISHLYSNETQFWGFWNSFSYKIVLKLHEAPRTVGTKRWMNLLFPLTATKIRPFHYTRGSASQISATRYKISLEKNTEIFRELFYGILRSWQVVVNKKFLWTMPEIVKKKVWTLVIHCFWNNTSEKWVHQFWIHSNDECNKWTIFCGSQRTQQIQSLLYGILQVFNTILCKDGFQNPQIFHQAVMFSQEHSYFRPRPLFCRTYQKPTTNIYRPVKIPWFDNVLREHLILLKLQQ